MVEIITSTTGSTAPRFALFLTELQILAAV
jgi:hypothetical protein